MTADERSIDDLQPVTPATTVDVDRIDFGDLAQQAEADNIEDEPPDGPLELVDAPVPATGSKSGSGKRRNHRRPAA